jgi:hypothetical protein
MHDKMQANLICAIIAGNFLTKDEDRFVTEHLFLHGRIERLTNCHLKGKCETAHARLTTRALTELPPASVANERNACLRRANDALARKLDRVGVKREKARVAMDVFFVSFDGRKRWRRGQVGEGGNLVNAERTMIEARLCNAF